MDYLIYIIAAVFLPLFPLSMIFNILYSRIHNPLIRSFLLIIWPQTGLFLLFTYKSVVPEWLVIWALVTSLLYALRALVLRDLNLWTAFVATSFWSLLWILYEIGTGAFQMQLFALGISIPLLLMMFLCAVLDRRFGAAYLGLYGALAQSMPRFTFVLVFVVLAVIATPLFPTFFAMLSIIVKSIPVKPVLAVGVSIVWLLWSWSGAKLLQGLLVGQSDDGSVVADLGMVKMWIAIITLAGLLMMSLYCFEALV